METCCKITPQESSDAANILKAVPQSMLLIKSREITSLIKDQDNQPHQLRHNKNRLMCHIRRESDEPKANVCVKQQRRSWNRLSSTSWSTMVGDTYSWITDGVWRR